MKTYFSLCQFKKYMANLVLILLPFSLAGAQSFAALTVESAGQQTFDIATNTTYLPDGGKIIDETAKLSLTGTNITYQEGTYIEAMGADVQGEFGSLQSPHMLITIPEQTLRAEAVTLNYKNLVVTADSIIIHLGPDIAKLSGNVQSDDPNFSSSSLVINLKTGFGLILSPFSYVNGPLVLKQESSDKNLQLSPIDNGDGTVNYQASSVIDQGLLESLGPYLNP